MTLAVQAGVFDANLGVKKAVVAGSAAEDRPGVELASDRWRFV